MKTITLKSFDRKSILEFLSMFNFPVIKMKSYRRHYRATSHLSKTFGSCGPKIWNCLIVKVTQPLQQGHVDQLQRKNYLLPKASATDDFISEMDTEMLQFTLTPNIVPSKYVE